MYCYTDTEIPNIRWLISIVCAISYYLLPIGLFDILYVAM